MADLDILAAPLPLVDLSRSTVAMTTRDENDHLEARRLEAERWIRENGRACANRIQSVLAARRKHAPVEADIRPLLRVVR